MAVAAGFSPTTPADAGRGRTRLFLLLIVAAALLLRLWGIGWALPNADRYFSYHPDESRVVSAALTVNPFLLLLDPGFYNYGSLSLLIDGGVIHAGQAVGLLGDGPLPGIPSAAALLAARLVTVAMGTATCLLLYGAGRQIYGKMAGLAAAALFAIAPLAVQHGHWATVDIPATFWIAGALFFAARTQSAEARPRDLLWCGVWAGLAAATKYNAGLVLFSGIAAWALARSRKAPPAPNNGGAASGGDLPSLLVGAVVAFLVGCPGIVLNFPAFRHDFAYEAFHVRSGHGDLFDRTPSGFIYHVGFNLNWGLTWPLLLVVLAGVGSALWRRRPGDLLLLAFAAPYYMLIGMAQVKFARYTLPLFPPLLLMAGALISPATQKRAARIVIGAVGAATAFAVLFTLALDAAMVSPDTRDEAVAFIRSSHITSVGFPTGPWFYAPPLNPMLTIFAPAAAKQAASETQNIRLVPAQGEWNVSQVKGADAPEAVALSEFEYADALRGGNPDTRNYIDMVKAAYPHEHVFGSPLQVFGLPFTNLNARPSLPVQNMPHDMLYTNPTTVVFTR